jgi:hypothetical protein
VEWGYSFGTECGGDGGDRWGQGSGGSEEEEEVGEESKADGNCGVHVNE